MLSEWWDPFLGGWQIYAKQLCEMITWLYDCEIDVFTRKFIGAQGNKIEWNPTYTNKFKVFRIGPIWWFFSIFYRLAWLINTTFVLYKRSGQEKYDIIHAHATLPWLAAWIVWKLRKIPVIYTVHGTNQLDLGKKTFFYYIEKLLVVLMRYDTIISVSHKILQYKPRTKSISIVPPWIHVEYIDKTSAETTKKPWRNYIFVGRFDPIKWISNLINAIGRIDEDVLKKQWFHLSLVWDGPIYSDIKNLVASVWREEYCSFLWKKSFDDVIHEYKSHNIFVLPSLSEWQPIVVLEAMASRLPVIATNVWDNSTLINKDNGILVEPWDIDALKNAIEKTLHIDIATLQKMWESAYMSVRDRFDWKTIAEKIYTIYQNTITNFK